MCIITALLLALATSTAVEAQSMLPRKTLIANTTTAATTLAASMTTTENPIFSSLIASLLSASPSMPSEVSAWTSANTAYDQCPPLTLLPTNLSSVFAEYDREYTKWASKVAAGLGGIRTVDPIQVDAGYAFKLAFLGCSSANPMFSSVYYAAAAAATASGSQTSGSMRGVSSAWTVSILGAALACMMGVVAFLM